MTLLEQCKENLKQYDEQIYKSQETALKKIIEELEKRILLETKTGNKSYCSQKIYHYKNKFLEFVTSEILSSKHLYDKLVEHFKTSGFNIVCYENNNQLYFTISLT